MFVQHAAVLHLSVNVGADLSRTISVGLSLVGFVFAQHLLKILLLLAPLLLLQGSFHLHLLLKTVNKVDLGLELFLLLSALTQLFLAELTVATLLLLHDLFAVSLRLFKFALSEQFDMLLSERLVHASLLLLALLPLFLLLHLLVKLLSDQSASLLLASHCLLLLLVV